MRISPTPSNSASGFTTIAYPPPIEETTGQLNATVQAWFAAPVRATQVPAPEPPQARVGSAGSTSMRRRRRPMLPILVSYRLGLSWPARPIADAAGTAPPLCAAAGPPRPQHRD